MKTTQRNRKLLTGVPKNLHPLFWSFDVRRLDPERNAATVIIQTLNYGNLSHLRWMRDRYGKRRIRRVASTLPASALRPQAQRLATLLFDIRTFGHAPRRAHG